MYRLRALSHETLKLDLRARNHSVALLSLPYSSSTALSSHPLHFQLYLTAAFKTASHSPQLLSAPRAISYAARTTSPTSQKLFSPAHTSLISSPHQATEVSAPFLLPPRSPAAHAPITFPSEIKTSTTTANAPSPLAQRAQSTMSVALVPYIFFSAFSSTPLISFLPRTAFSLHLLCHFYPRPEHYRRTLFPPQPPFLLPVFTPELIFSKKHFFLLRAPSSQPVRSLRWLRPHHTHRLPKAPFFHLLSQKQTRHL